MLVTLRDPGFYISALAEQKIGDSLAQAGVADEVHTAGESRVEAPQPFVFAAGTGLEALDAVDDAVLDRRVVADIEMQERKVLEASPVTSVENSGLLQVNRAGD